MSLFTNPPERVIHVDKTESEPDEAEPRHFARVIVGVLGGLAIGLLLATGAQQNSPDSAATPSAIPEVAIPPTAPTTPQATLEPSRLDILVDGYEGTLYLAGRLNDEEKVWRWESRTGTPLSVEIPNLMVWADFSSSRARVATATYSTISPGLNLWVGTPGNAEPLALSITSWAWHTSDPNRIAWIELDQIVPGRALLRTATLPTGAESAFLIADDPADLESVPTLALFDDDGFVLQTMSEDGFMLLALDLEDGLESNRKSARLLGTLPSGDLLTSSSGSLQRVSRDLTEAIEFPFPSEMQMDAIERAPTGEQWAIWEMAETTGFSAPAQLWILRGEDILFEAALPSAVRATGWSQDGRWLIAAVGEPAPLSGSASGQLWFIDTEDWSMHAVDAPGYVFAIASVP